MVQNRTTPTRFSPPLTERPRLTRRPPPFGRGTSYLAADWGIPGRRPGISPEQYLRSNWTLPNPQDYYREDGPSNRMDDAGNLNLNEGSQL